MRKFLTTLTILTALAINVSAQKNQIEAKFIYHPNQNKFADTDGFGGGLELTTNLGEYIKLLQQLDVEKAREGDGLKSFSQRDITLQSTVRLYPVEGYASFKPFAQGGVRARFSRFSSSAAIILPIDPGALRTENKFTFASPFIGAGVNYKDFYILEYSYLLPDFASKIDKDVWGHPVLTFYRERGHYLRAKAFIPLSDKFSFNPSYEVYRRETDGLRPTYDQKLSFGLAYVFGEKDDHQYPQPMPKPGPVPPEK